MGKLTEIIAGGSGSKAKDTGPAKSKQSHSLQGKVGTYWQLNSKVMSTAAAYVVHVLRINRLVQF